LDWHGAFADASGEPVEEANMHMMELVEEG
jgi:hypothetical protein